MKKSSLELLEKLSQLDGIPGSEDQVRAFVRERLEGAGEFETDNLGSLICRKVGKSESPRVILPAHMDEIGFMVKDISDDGYLKFTALGGWLDQTMLGHVVTVKARKGEHIGVIGCMPPHLMPREDRDKLIKRTKMFIDVGAPDKKYVTEKMGIRIGDPIVPTEPFRVIGDGKSLLSKAWDNRIGVAIMIDVMLALKNIAHPNTVYGVGTTQEEVGTRGAETAADVVNPDFCIVLDVGLATDMPGIEGETKVDLGGGPIVYMMDAGTIGHRRFTNFAIDLAEKKKVPFQLSVMEGGSTDARAIGLHGRGVPSLVLGIPARYIHSHAGLVHTDDYDASLKFVLEVLKALSPEAAREVMAE